jgi:hypothetical protein
MYFVVADWRMVVQKKYDTQLYNLLRRLALYDLNEDEQGRAVSYAVCSSLIDFHTTSGSLEEVHFQQVKYVYKGLEQLCSTIIPATLMCVMMQRVQEYYDRHCPDCSPECCHKKVPESGSELLHDIMCRLHSYDRNLEDRFRRSGKSLMRAVDRSGAVLGRGNSLNHDYRLLREHLVER